MPAAVFKMSNPTLDYDWGSDEALARLQRRPFPTERPEAEIWIGAHAKAPSSIEVDGQRVLLSEWAGAKPAPDVETAVANRFPVLVKLLAAARPLSLQVHPGRQAAQDGFSRENALGLALDSGERCYRDPEPKTEVLVALTAFEGLAGFQQDEAVREALSATGSPAARRLLGEAARVATPGTLAATLLEALLATREGPVPPAIGELSAWARAHAESDSRARLMAQLADEHPEDRALPAPLLLNAFSLAPGEAVLVRPGTIHSYSSGLGLEVMTPSDNVVRGGLTAKHVALAELVRLLEREASAPRILRARADADSDLETYDLATEPFAVGRQEVDGEAPPPVLRGSELDPGLLIGVCTRGRVRLRGPGDGSAIVLEAGESAFIPDARKAPRATGRGELYWIAA